LQAILYAEKRRKKEKNVELMRTRGEVRFRKTTRKEKSLPRSEETQAIKISNSAPRPKIIKREDKAKNQEKKATRKKKRGEGEKGSLLPQEGEREKPNPEPLRGEC